MRGLAVLLCCLGAVFASPQTPTAAYGPGGLCRLDHGAGLYVDRMDYRIGESVQCQAEEGATEVCLCVVPMGGELGACVSLHGATISSCGDMMSQKVRRSRLEESQLQSDWDAEEIRREHDSSFRAAHGPRYSSNEKRDERASDYDGYESQAFYPSFGYAGGVGKRHRSDQRPGWPDVRR